MAISLLKEWEITHPAKRNKKYVFGPTLSYRQLSALESLFTYIIFNPDL